jgi:hypothetical protein
MSTQRRPAIVPLCRLPPFIATIVSIARREARAKTAAELVLRAVKTLDL